MSVGSVCAREVVTASPRATVTEVASLMRSAHVGTVVIVEESEGRRFPVGVITDRDIVVEVVAPGLDPEILLAADVMTTSPVTVEEGGEIKDAAQMLCLRGVRRAPVMSAAGNLVGMVSVSDLLGSLADELTTLTRLSGRQREREAKFRA